MGLARFLIASGVLLAAVAAAMSRDSMEQHSPSSPTGPLNSYILAGFTSMRVLSIMALIVGLISVWICHMRWRPVALPLELPYTVDNAALGDLGPTVDNAALRDLGPTVNNAALGALASTEGKNNWRLQDHGEALLLEINGGSESSGGHADAIDAIASGKNPFRWCSYISGLQIKFNGGFESTVQ
ncbi:hypothetical protein Dimus_007755 [Dionaea muscipula]